MEDAEYYLPLKTNKAVPTLFYKFIDIKINNGTIWHCLHYYSSCGGGWTPSVENREKVAEFINDNLIKL